ncbi:transcriptional regulator [Micromonospora sp. HNM0581]|uniref:transcriptional regulator BldD n=1 Tax=Micromonospora sp. HNM0581 TaxID=2716341 RepID=UPI00146AEE05|nr:transcriptional regulator [Micromonospora sp. HNM0581]NLU80484.1 transcriptional regulator [Micromonospora sp. HNM0581]
MPSEYAKSLGARLRSIRQQQGLSLQGVEEKSNGRWKAVVVGSYERGDRAVTVSRLAELAEFYRVPVSELLPDGSGVRHEPTSKIVLDLERLYDQAGEDLAYVARYARAIQQQRGDYNGRVLSIRADDLRALAIVYDASPSGLIERLTEHGVLVADPRAFFAS